MQIKINSKLGYKPILSEYEIECLGKTYLRMNNNKKFKSKYKTFEEFVNAEMNKECSEIFTALKRNK